jgi:RNA polymerase sigma-70 factor (ECF subfamily)
MNSNDHDLLLRAQTFDQQALAEIYDRYQAGMYRYALRLLGDEALAEDCVADTYLRFLRALRHGQGPQSSLQAYLYRVAHNWITDYYRSRPLPALELDENLHSSEACLPDHQAELRFLQMEMRHALRRLTPDQRQVILLRFFENWSNEAVAEALQKPVGAVKALQHRALAALGRMLTDPKTEVFYESIA